MALSYGFFNAQLDSQGKYDREYQAEHFAEYFHLFVGNGVFPDGATQLQVVSSVPASMSVMVSAGFGWINGYYAKNSSNYPLSINVAHASLPRRDAVVLRWVNATREMILAVKTGTPASSPAIPSLTRNTEVYEIMLAIISVAAGATNISQSAITDKRPDTSVCGWVTGLIDQIDTTNLFAQYNTAFNEWFDNIKAQLSGNVATNLQNQINALSDRVTVTETNTIPISRGGTGQTSGAAGLHALINAASTLSSTGLATGDYIALDDVSASTGKKVTIANLASYLNTSQGISKVATGSYTGTGTYGASNPNSITFPFTPKLVWIYAEYKDSHTEYGYAPIIVMDPANWKAVTVLCFTDLSTSYQQGKGFLRGYDSKVNKSTSYAKRSGNTLYWYNTKAGGQLNDEGMTFYWVAFS